jgi:AsmA protein
LKGYSLRVDGVVADLSQLDWLSPVPLPPLKGVTLTAKLFDQGGPVPDISGVSIQASPTNLERVASGFSIDVARIDAPRLTEPVQVDVEGALVGAPVKLTATLGAPALLLPGARPGQKFLVNIVGEAVGASFGARGEIFSPANYSGMDIAVAARIPDLDRLSPLAGTRLPALKSIAFSGRLTDGFHGFLGGIGLHDTKLELPEADLQGDVTLIFGSRPGVKTTLFSRRIDADTLVTMFAPVVGSGPDMAGLSAGSPDPSRPLLLAPRPLITAIPDTPLPLRVLDFADLDVNLTVGDMLLGGTTYSDISGHLVVHDGALTLDPFAMRLPGGRIEARLAVGSNQTSPPVALMLHAPNLELKPLMEAFGWPVQGAGTVDVDANLHGQGNTLHAIAASLDGHVGLGIADAEVDDNVLDPALRALVIAVDPGEAGRTKLRCAVLQADASRGMVTLGTLVIDSTRFLLNAAGTVNLADEIMALQVRPMMRTGGPGVVVPVRVDGAFRDLKFTRNAPSSGPAVTFPSERGADACGPALAAVRTRPSGAAAAPLAVSPAAPLAAGPTVVTPAAQAPLSLSPRRPTQ